jgi:hypothetical protein
MTCESPWMAKTNSGCARDTLLLQKESTGSVTTPFTSGPDCRKRQPYARSWNRDEEAFVCKRNCSGQRVNVRHTPSLSSHPSLRVSASDFSIAGHGALTRRAGRGPDTTKWAPVVRPLRSWIFGAEFGSHSKRCHWIDSGGATRRNVAGHERNQ